MKTEGQRENDLDSLAMKLRFRKGTCLNVRAIWEMKFLMLIWKMPLLGGNALPLLE
jgi:hypothetical protein